MLDSERTFKIKVRLPRTVFEILLTSAIICICRLFAIICSPYKVLEVLKQSVYFLKVVEFCPTFDIQIDTLAIFREKLQNHTF